MQAWNAWNILKHSWPPAEERPPNSRLYVAQTSEGLLERMVGWKHPSFRRCQTSEHLRQKNAIRCLLDILTGCLLNLNCGKSCLPGYSSWGPTFRLIQLKLHQESLLWGLRPSHRTHQTAHESLETSMQGIHLDKTNRAGKHSIIFAATWLVTKRMVLRHILVLIDFCDCASASIMNTNQRVNFQMALSWHRAWQHPSVPQLIRSIKSHFISYLK